MFRKTVRQKQNEITKPTKLLTKKGYVKEPGWARRNTLIQYNREAISAHPLRIKEWDFYQICDGRYMTQFTIANISMAEAGCVTITDLKTGALLLCAAMAHVYTVNRFPMPRSSEDPQKISRHYGYFKMKIESDGETYRHLTASGVALWPLGKKFKLDYYLEIPKDNESITISIPWKKKDAPGSKKLKDHFFLTNKANCMPVNGFVNIGKKQLLFTPDKTFGVLDWGRGVWAHNIRWIWGNGTTYINGKLFGFEQTWGFGDDSDATETCLFYDGKAHKLGKCTVDYDKKRPGKHPWVFHEENGRFEMTMVPFYNNHLGFDLGIVGAHNDQCHGLWSGTVTLDDGTVLEIKDMYAFCEQVHLKW